MAQGGSSATPSSGFLSAVVADGRAAMPRLPGATASEVDGPHELAIERMVGPPRHGGPDPRPARLPRIAPAAAALTRQGREPSSDAQAPAAPFVAGFEPAQQQAAATERDAENDPAIAEMVAPEAALHGEVIREGAQPSQSDRALEHVDLPTRLPFAARPEPSASATDSGAKMRDRGMRQAPARGGEDTRSASRGPARAGTWLSRAIQPANGSRPQTAPPAVRIGTLDIRIEAPKQRATPPPRQPVRFRGSSILSRLYLRRE